MEKCKYVESIRVASEGERDGIKIADMRFNF